MGRANHARSDFTGVCDVLMPRRDVAAVSGHDGDMIRCLSLLCLLVGCIDRVPQADDDALDMGRTDLGDGGGIISDFHVVDAVVGRFDGTPDDDWTVFEPGAPITTPPTTALFAPDFDAEPRSIMQGGDHQLIWAGDRYVLLWMQNIGGRVQVVGLTVRDGVASPLTQLTTRDDPDQPSSKDRMFGVWQDERLIVFWTADAGLWMQPFDRALRPSGPVVEVRAPSEGQFLSIFDVEPVQGDLGIAFGLSAEGYHPRLMRLARDGSPIALGDYVFERMSEGRASVLVGLLADEDRFDSLWSARQPAAADTVFRAGLERTGFATAVTGPLYTSDNNIPQHFGVGLGVPFMVVDDLDAGLLLFQLDEQERPTPVRLGGSGGAAVEHAPSAAQIAFVRETGVASGGLPSGLSFQAYDYRRDTLGPAHPIVEFDGCLEDFDMVYTGDRLGVSYALGCSTRRLYLREVRLRMR